MTGDTTLFQELLKQGSSFAWNGQWELAAQSYRRALEECPGELTAKTQLAMALFKSNQLQDALLLYRELWNAQPSNLSLLKRMAEIYEALGDTSAAASCHQILAEGGHPRRTAQDAPMDVVVTQQTGAKKDVGALLESAHLHISSGELDIAEEEVCQALQAVEMEGADKAEPAAEVLLELAKKKATGGNLGDAAEILYWIQYGSLAAALPTKLIERSVDAAAEYFGRFASEHLEDLVRLPAEAREGVILALKEINELLETGKLRSSADGVYRLIAAHPDFLPAQLLLAKVLLAQGREDDAREKARRLIDLYELRGATRQAQMVAEWMAQICKVGGGFGAQLVQLPIDSAPSVPTQAHHVAQEAIDTTTSADEKPFWDALLDSAESSISAGCRDTAVELLRSTLEIDGGKDPVARAALLRILQMIEPDESVRAELADLLYELGKPITLSNR